jgi:hypothetical protein
MLYLAKMKAKMKLQLMLMVDKFEVRNDQGFEQNRVLMFNVNKRQLTNEIILLLIYFFRKKIVEINFSW